MPEVVWAIGLNRIDAGPVQPPISLNSRRLLPHKECARRVTPLVKRLRLRKAGIEVADSLEHDSSEARVVGGQVRAELVLRDGAVAGRVRHRRELVADHEATAVFGRLLEPDGLRIQTHLSKVDPVEEKRSLKLLRLRFPDVGSVHV